MFIKINTTSVEDDIVFEYTYDANGNILTAKTTTITNGTTVEKATKYTYDKANQLIREDNQAANKTWIWTYDNAGNITSHAEYAYTPAATPSGATPTSYTYGKSQWKDLLTKVGTNAITYDEIGNMLTYNGSTFTWEHGRELQKLTYNVGNDSNTANDLKWEFVYNADGLRTMRTDGTIKYVNGAITVENANKTYNYVYNGSSLSQMSIVTGTGDSATTTTLNFCL